MIAFLHTSRTRSKYRGKDNGVYMVLQKLMFIIYVIIGHKTTINYKASTSIDLAVIQLGRNITDSSVSENADVMCYVMYVYVHVPAGTQVLL